MGSITERQARLWCLIIGAGAGLVAGLSRILAGDMLVVAVGGGVGALLGALAVLYWRGWEPARLLAIGIFTLGVIGALEPGRVLVGVMIVATFALLLSNSRIVIAVSALTAVALVFRDGFSLGWDAVIVPGDAIVMVALVGILAITRFALEVELRRSEALTAEARTAQAATATQAQALERQTEALTRQNEEQHRLLDLVATLEATVVTIASGVALVPISGYLNTDRAANLTARLLALVSEQRLRLVLLDLSGVPAVDAEVAQALQRLIQAIQLLGCQVNISGISAPVAGTMAQLGLMLHGVRTWRSPQEALAALS